ncbi:hypothetical protein [Burkholderia gladioli]|uniref:hypothetical protein n=1 Tax=Burkholderia gladioli TaxID=28095 RepID=UPI0015E7B786|nr:hypothetical protein [Burkholderia gladioli]MBA1364055.1 hypothetical protein [Burkholderia gladioli]
MAARLRKTHQEDVRAKIQASQLINRLQDHALGKLKDLSPTQMRAIEILLKKILPDLGQIQLSNAPGEALQLTISTKPKDAA